jgi:mRNA interferase RelE/StbE
VAEYRIRRAAAATREFDALPADVRARIRAAVVRLGREPRPRGCKKLTGEQQLYRIRVGSYRVVYAIRDAEREVIVLRVRHRRDVYD